MANEDSPDISGEHRSTELHQILVSDIDEQILPDSGRVKMVKTVKEPKVDQAELVLSDSEEKGVLPAEEHSDEEKPIMNSGKYTRYTPPDESKHDTSGEWIPGEVAFPDVSTVQPLHADSKIPRAATAHQSKFAATPSTDVIPRTYQKSTHKTLKIAKQPKPTRDGDEKYRNLFIAKTGDPPYNGGILEAVDLTSLLS